MHGRTHTYRTENGETITRLLIQILTAVLLIPILIPIGASAQDLTLPVYEINIDPDYIAALDANPNSNVTYPGTVLYNNVPYSCQIRYRGGESLLLPKRSWKIFFNGGGPEGLSETNLNAEYKDYSICRNYLTMKLGQRLGLDVPDTRFVSVKLNGDYVGVYHEIEQVDNDFFTSRGLGGGALFKGINQGARFAPAMEADDLTDYFEVQVSAEGGVDTLGARCAFIQNMDFFNVNSGLPTIIDVSNFIDFFALMFCVGNEDGMVKNYYIHAGVDSRYTLVPWDCDATFGNTEEGELENPSDRLVFDQLDNQGVFQRIISDPAYKAELMSSIDYTINFGFDGINDDLTAIYDEIRNDIYQDDMNRGSNEDFEAEYYQILTYMFDRKARLQSLDYFNRVDLIEFSATDYISAPDDPILFKANVTASVYSAAVFVYDINENDTLIYLVDDGTNGDITAGDLEFAKQVSIPGMSPPYYYCFRINSSSSEAYMTPPAGFYKYEDYPLSLPSIHLNSDPPAVGDVEIGSVHLSNNTNTTYFALANKSAGSLDLSGMVVRIGSGHEFIRVPEVAPLAPLDTLYISNHKETAQGLVSGKPVIGGFYFNIAVGDTLKAETCSGDLLHSKSVDEIISFGETVGAVVINEINYHSLGAFDPGDWVEIVARIGNHDLSGWQLKDSKDDNIYVIPAGTYIEEGDFLVLAKDSLAFHYRFPEVTNVIGNYGFGFGGTGDSVRLFDSGNIMIDWVAYLDQPPWPEAPDGDGPTLELMDPALPNFFYTYWSSSDSPNYYGTPGDTNTAYYRYHIDEFPVIPESWEIISVYPNPFSEILNISYYAPQAGLIKLRIYDILGRRVAQISEMVSDGGFYSMIWDGKDSDGFETASGIYFLRLETKRMSPVIKVVHIRYKQH